MTYIARRHNYTLRLQQPLGIRKYSDLIIAYA